MRSAGARRRLWIFGAGCVWLALICGGTRTLLNYSYAQGKAGEPPGIWPAGSQIHRPPGGFVLVMTVHPRCTCSVATLAELQEFLTRAPGPPATYVIFHVEDSDRAKTMQTDLWRKAAAIPGVVLLADDGTEAEMFGANTSGETMLYDASGRLRFHGGITGGRGHAGENYGLNTLLAAAGGTANHEATAVQRGGAGELETAASERAPVFGCPLHDPSPTELRKDRSWKRH